MEPVQIVGLTPQRVLDQIVFDSRVRVTRQDLQAILDTIHPISNVTLTLEEAEQFIDLLTRRNEGEPLAYLLQHTPFMERTFYINRHVMVTRPKMATVVRVALQIAAKLHARFPLHTLPVAEVGTGCGALAITFALHEPRCPTIYASDVSTEALAVAAHNCREHMVADRVLLLQGNLLKPLPERVRLLIANLPFMAHGQREDLAPEVRESEPCIRQYEPPLAIFGDEDGLGHQRRMLCMASEYLLPAAVILLTLHSSQKEQIEQIISQALPQAHVDFMAIDADWSTLAVIEMP